MMMEGGTVVICQFGGEFVTNGDGSMTYAGGEAHVIDVDRNMTFNDFKTEITNLFNIDMIAMSIKYFLHNNRRTLITVSCDKDLRRMIDLNANIGTVDVYILNKSENRATRSVVADSGTSTVATPTTKNSARQKRAASCASSGRVTKSKIRVDNPTVSEVFTGSAIDIGEGRTSIVEIDNRNIAVNVNYPMIDIVATENPGDLIPCITDDMENRGNGNLIVSLSDPGALSVSTVDDIRNSYLPVLCDDIITGVGQEFDNVKDFRDKLSEYAINKGFIYKFIKNETTRLTVKCSAENCPWRLHASQLPRRKKFMIKRFNNVHTCEGVIDKDGQRRVTKKMLVNIIKEKLRNTPECKPKEIAEDIYRDFGVNVNYFKIWRAKTDAERELFNMHVEACNQLPWFCERILESNPGSVVTLATSADSKFRVFVSFHSSLHGFEHGCRPLLFLDRIPLKKSSQLKLLVAAGVDADDGIYPVAFSAVEAESYDSWQWFLEQLKYAVAASRTITFVSNRQNGLMEAVPQVFPESFHSYCLIDLVEDFRAELKRGPWSDEEKDAMVSDFECAAQACLVEEFNAYIESISKISKEAADWVLSSNPEHWSNALFRGSRYSHYSADIIEFSDWISVKQEASVILIIDAIRSKIMEVTRSRLEMSNAWDSVLTPSMEQKLKKEISKAHKFEVLCSSDTVFEVRGSTINVIDMGSWECTCRRWQITGLPCVHAIAVIDHQGRSIYDYCSRFFRTDCFRVAYSETPNEILEAEKLTSVLRANLYPPPNRQLKWPRRKRDRRKKGEVRALHCSRCKQAGHNKATCEALV